MKVSQTFLSIAFYESSRLITVHATYTSNSSCMASLLQQAIQLSGVEKVTPHGFRATISSLLSERGIDLNSIRFLLGHSEKDNLHFYIRRYGRLIQVLRRELTRLEEELTQENAKVICRLTESTNLQNKMGEVYLSQSPIIQKETLIQLLQTHLDVAAMILQKGLVQL